MQLLHFVEKIGARIACSALRVARLESLRRLFLHIKADAGHRRILLIEVATNTPSKRVNRSA